MSTTSPGSRRRPCLRRTGFALLATTVLLPLGAVSATAAIEPVALPLGITLFPERDFLGVEGFSGDAPVTINVYRGDVKVGTAHGTPLPNAETGTLLEVNHPGGVCWSGVTPDLLPGDRVEVVSDDMGEDGQPVGAFSNLLDVAAEAAVASDLDGDGVKDDIVVHGTATAADGTKMDPTLMEQRIVAPDLKEIPAIDRRDIRALFTGGIADGVPSTGDIEWDDPDDPLNTSWTATYTDIGADVVDIAVAGQTRVLAWERTDVLDNRIGMTIFEADEIGGPGFGGCPALASDAVTGTVPANVNRAAVAAGGNLVINGTSHGAATVDLTLDDHDADPSDVLQVTAIPNNQPSSDPAVPLVRRAQTWRATLPMAQLAAAGIDPGELTISGRFHRMTERTETQLQDTDGDPLTEPVPVEVVIRETRAIGGADHVLLKDLVAPPAPSASPEPGTYFGTQSVDLSADDQAEETVRYRIGTATVPAPTSASPAVSGQLVVSSSQTIKAVSFDRAGNPSPVLVAGYTISAAGVPTAPSAVTGVSGLDAQTRLSWTAPSSANGSAVTGYVVRGYTDSSAVPALERSVPNVTSATIGDLVNETSYTFTVAAVNGIGESVQSERSGQVLPKAPARAPFAPEVGTATGLNASANLTWTPPSSDGGSPVTGYRVTAYNSATGLQTGAVRTAPATATSLLVAGLVNGTPYDFEVRAVNALGTGEPSERSNTVVPATLASAPSGQAATAGTGSAVVTWNAPANDGGAEISAYQVQVRTGTTVRRTIEVFDTEAEVFQLTNGTAYNFRIRAVTSAGLGALSGATNAVTPTAPAPVNPAPTVTATSPAAGATGVAVGANVTATFSEAVTGVSAATVTLRSSAGATVAAVVGYNATSRVATLNPNANLAAGTSYTATLTGGIADTQGTPLATHTWSFTTAAAANAAPRVTARTPAVNAAGVGVGVNVTATFSEAVTGVSATTVTLRSPAGTTVAAVVSYNATTRVATLNPNANLARNTVYTVTLTGGATAIRDTQGAGLATTTWSFRTIV